MKKRKNAKKASETLGVIFFFVIFSFLAKQLVIKYEVRREKDKIYVELAYEESESLIELPKHSSAKMISDFCPPTSLAELDRVELGKRSCQVVKKGASNWSRFALGKKMMLNQATSEQVRIIKGIGSKRAEELIQLRGELAGFKDFSQLQKLSWIDKKILDELKRFFCLEDG